MSGTAVEEEVASDCGIEDWLAFVAEAGPQIETRGFLAAAFDHRDSRAGDPDLHTHLAISNKVRARDDHPDGRPRWLSLDARVIHAAAVAASERYNTRVEDALTRRLGVEFTERAETLRRDKRPVREIAGMPGVLIKHFSRRRAAIEDRYRDLAADYRRTHGHEPPREAQLKLAQQATLETRDHKARPTSLAEKITGWRAEAAAVLGATGLADLEHDVLHRDLTTTTPASLPVDEIARSVVEVVSEEKATTSRESLYVAATRGRHGAQLYVTNEDLIGIDAERPPAPAQSARDILTDTLHRESGERSATEVRRDATTHAAARQRAGRRYLHHTVLRDHHVRTVTRALGSAMARDVINGPAFPPGSEARCPGEDRARPRPEPPTGSTTPRTAVRRIRRQGPHPPTGADHGERRGRR